MKLKHNIIASYASQIFVTLVGILMLPLYLQYMGAEAYGLVGFFTMLPAWFNLLDMGLSPTVARETARFHGGATDALSYRRLLRALQIIFLAVALLGGGLLFVFAGEIAQRWLKVQTLSLAEVKHALQLMACGVALRWMSGLYRGCVSGAERLIWLSGFTSFIAALRFIGVLPVLIWVGHTPAIFFTYQLLVAVVEQAGLFIMARHLAPALPAGTRLGWSAATLFAPIKPVLAFALSAAFTSSVWVLSTQTDKLLLSRILPLAEYGYFTLAVLVAGGIMMVGGPISSAIMPRMTRLQAEGQDAQLIAVYRQATQLVVVLALPVALVLIFFAPQVLWAWTGDAALVKRAAPVLSLYAAGYAFLAVGAFPYYLQYAKGNLRLHLIGNALLLMLLIPSIVWAATHYGMVGAGWAWLVSNAVCFVLWVPLVHRKFAPGMHWGWIASDILTPALFPFALAALIAHFIHWPHQRAPLIAALIFVGCTLLIACAIGGNFTRELIKHDNNSAKKPGIKNH